jgi:DNA-binding transcriptional ArsR family regulator
MSSGLDRDRRWSFVTNHARVLAYIAVGITERTAGQIVTDLEQAGYLSKSRDGRRNQYAVDGDKKLGHARLKGLAAGQVLSLLLEVFDQQPLL